MTVSINGTSGIVNDATDLNYTGTLTGGTGVVNLGSGQFYKDASGNVGIGGAATNEGGYARVLQVTGSTEAALELKTGSNFSYVAQNGTTLQIKNNATAGVMTFATEATERARIDSSGNLLVGTTTKNADGRVSISADSATHQGITIKDLSGANNVAYILFTNSLGNTAGLIVHSGSTTVSYTTSSDYRMKENIAPMTGALTAVSQLKPCTYTWKEDGKAGQGFIAHELQEVVPDCVYGEKDAVDADGNPQYQGIDTSFLVATLAAAIQELKAIVDAQAARITALEAA